jgi:hypothetical protein
MPGCSQALIDARRLGGLAQLPQTDVAEIQRVHCETLTGEKQRVAAVAGPQLEHVSGARALEDVGGVDGRGGGLVAIHGRVGGIAGVPVVALPVAWHVSHFALLKRLG